MLKLLHIICREVSACNLNYNIFNRQMALHASRTQLSPFSSRDVNIDACARLYVASFS